MTIAQMQYSDIIPNMRVVIKTNAHELAEDLDQIAKSQIPFATSKAINSLAYDLRDSAQRRVPLFFNLRTNRLRTKGAMPVIPSTKKQFPNTHAIIGVRDEIAALNATGGTRHPGKGSKVAVPYQNAPGQAISTRKKLNPGAMTLGPAKFPARILAKARPKTQKRRKSGSYSPFLIKSGSKQYVATRIQTSTGSRVLFLYGFKKSVQVDKQWPLVENTEALAGKLYPSYFTNALNSAIKSARP